MTTAVRIPPAEPFPVHQRRTVVAALPGLAGPTAWLSREYVGGVLVSVPPGGGRPDTIARFVAAGCGPSRVTFYSAPGQPDVERLCRLLPAFAPQVSRSATGLWSTMAEIIAVGATHVLGFGTDVVVTARVVALRINRALGSAELALPVPVPAPATPAGPPPAGPPPAGPALTGGPADAVSEDDVEQLVDTGNRWLTPEWEQRADLLETIVEVS